MKKLLFALALVASPLQAQVISSPAQQVQGTSAVNRGNAVNVRLTDGAGVAVTSTVPTGTAGTPATDVVSVQGVVGGTAQPVSAASLPLPSGASTSAAQATAATALGAPGDTACATDTASCGLNAQGQRTNQRLTTINTTLGTPFQASGALGAGSAIIGNVRIDQTTPGTTNGVVPAGNVAHDAVDSGNPVKMGCYASQTAPTAISADGDRTNMWCGRVGQVFTTLTSQTGASIVDVGGLGDADGGGASLATRAFGYAYNGTNYDRFRGNTNGLVTQPYALTTARWFYTSGTSPILSNTTTAVTIKTAAGASVRNYITSCQITTTAFTASVPLAIRDGAAGTVIWALTVPLAGFLQPVTITFPVPLQSTANTLLEIVTTTANTTGTVTASCQGFTGS